MSKLISGKEALIALANDQEVEYFDEKLGEWVYMDITHHFKREFRLKPRTITINGVEVPAPFRPKEGEVYYYLSFEFEAGYSRWNQIGCDTCGAWRTEEEIIQVIAALRIAFKPQ